MKTMNIKFLLLYFSHSAFLHIEALLRGLFNFDEIEACVRSELVRKLTEEKKEEMEFLKVTKACKMKLVVVGEEKNKKANQKTW